MGLFEFSLRTAVRVAVSPVAIVHDIVTLPSNALGETKAMMPELAKTILDDAKKTLRVGKL
jgi:hypothetical protein